MKSYCKNVPNLLAHQGDNPFLGEDDENEDEEEEDTEEEDDSEEEEEEENWQDVNVHLYSYTPVTGIQVEKTCETST